VNCSVTGKEATVSIADKGIGIFDSDQERLLKDSIVQKMTIHLKLPFWYRSLFMQRNY
jgi:hypothetical protein